MAGYGGKRPGAGRKKGSINVLTALKRGETEINQVQGAKAKKAVAAAVILGVVDEVKLWAELLESPREAIRLDALKYLTDKRDGRAKQAVEVTGDMAIRQMSDEELLRRWTNLASSLNIPAQIVSDC
jgi:hypothetical protein